ncbi:hypothetical protein DL96DRAFT_1683698 [Flagelloscypha sp. PMI_526]|nr:hypothetical protein DL96DRAFT_1683698 [Flagelloscypha sp. PMI_526]
MFATQNIPHSERRMRTPGTGLRNRRENAHIPGTGQRLKTLALETPGQSSPSKPGKSLLRNGNNPLLLNRALHDKTPLANRQLVFQTPNPNSTKSVLSKPIFLRGLSEEGVNTPLQQRRPSSTRRHSRVPRSASRSFESPEQHSGANLLSVDLDLADTECEQIEELVAEDDDDEVEYCPPNTLELPYQPPFDFEMPDYLSLGHTLRDFDVRLEQDEEFCLGMADDAALDLSEMDSNLCLPELEDDPFAFLKSAPPVSLSKPAPSTSRTPSVMSTATASRKLPARPPTSARSHPAPPIRRAPPGPSKLGGVPPTVKDKAPTIGSRSHPALQSRTRPKPAAGTEPSRARVTGPTRPGPSSTRPASASSRPAMQSRAVSRTVTSKLSTPVTEDIVRRIAKEKLECEEFRFEV